MQQSIARRSEASKMNPKINFCILSVMLLQAAALDPFAGITRLKNTVKSVSNDLTRYNNNLRFNVNIKLGNLKIEQMTNVNTAVNTALSETKNAIAAAKNEGRDAEHCYEPTRQRLGDASKLAFSDLDKCVKNELDTLQPIEQNIASLLNTGKSLLSTLDSIAVECTSANPLQTQKCVVEKLPVASQAVRNFENTANLLKDSGDSFSSAAVINAIHCFQTPMNKLYENVSSARIFMTNCIKSSTN